MKRKQIQRTNDKYGDEVVIVPLGRKGECHAIMLATDFDYLTKELGLSPTWQVIRGGYVSAVAYLAPGSQIMVARVLLDAGPSQSIRYKDKNPLNLKRDNLLLLNGGGSTRRDRDFITPKDKQYKKGKNL